MDMKNLIRLCAIGLCASLTLSGCHKVLDFRNAEISNNKVFEEGGNKPFTGTLTNIPLHKLPTTSILGISKLISTTTGDNGFYQLFLSGTIAGVLNTQGGSVLCDVDINKGQPQGEASCQLSTLDMPLLKLPFKNGSLDGGVVLYDFREKGKVIAEFPFTSGQTNGTSKIYSPKTGKLVHSAEWVNGQANGVEEAFYEDTGAIKFHGVLVNNRYDGETIGYAPDGTQTKQLWDKGVPIQNTSPASVSSSSSSEDVACLDLWIEAHRKEKGDDALVSNDQLTEWGDWCAAGKKPQ